MGSNSLITYGHSYFLNIPYEMQTERLSTACTYVYTCGTKDEEMLT